MRNASKLCLNILLLLPQILLVPKKEKKWRGIHSWTHPHVLVAVKTHF